MHLLAVQPGQVLDGEEAVDLGQSPGEIVVLSAADSDLACLSQALAGLPDDFPTVRLANLLRLKHPLSVDLYVESVVEKARIVVARLVGGRAYWPYGLDEIAAACRRRGTLFVALLDEEAPGAAGGEGRAASVAPPEVCERIFAYLRQGGVVNARNLLLYAADMIGRPHGAWSEPAPLLDAGFYWPGRRVTDLAGLRADWSPQRPKAALVFYRALVAAGTTQTVDAHIEALVARGFDVAPIFVQSLKNAFAAGLVGETFAAIAPDVVLNATAFAVSNPGDDRRASPLETGQAVVLQLVFAGLDRAAWEDSPRGLGARDLAMNVALPELDGRVLAGATAFKAALRHDPRTECDVVSHAPAHDRIAFAADLARGWADLRRAPTSERRVALVMANYPNRDSRLGNGVGLDTPASVTAILEAMAAAGYGLEGAPETSAALMDRLRAGVTNAAVAGRTAGPKLSLTQYAAFFSTLPETVRAAVTARWGGPEQDPAFVDGGFELPLHVFGQVVVGVQPARGYNIDPKSTYHDPDLVPPHNYLAFYAWLRTVFAAHAVVHVGKHGNLEWLPGKALALSEACFPQAIAGPVPQLYPFIVNDPGEGTQAKRRIGAVIVDHLTPPLTRAESYGPLKALEALVDEYYEAAGLDPRRLKPLREEILALAASQGLDVDCGMDLADADQALSALDNYLCDLKEMQIRDGLHVFGISPGGRLRDDLIVALARTPRGLGKGREGSLLRALADDLGLAFDPLDARLGEAWTGSRPQALASLSSDAWRTTGDTVERLELLASSLVAGDDADPAWVRAAAVLEEVRERLGPRVDACGEAEMAALLTGLAGRFVAPGPSGAPTRGRPDVLPTGRNFYSVDTRAVPTPTAWRLGWASAQLLVEDHLQQVGDYPKAVALSAWGTANMRTGGDDVAQALALMGCRPTWEASTGRVTGFEILPLAVLGRPRVDVTLRISGFFRDAFGQQIDLLDSAARAVMALDESAKDNPAAARFQAEGGDAAAGARVFGSKPGAYGAGLQAMFDEKLWKDRADLAEAFLVWGGYAYGAGGEGQAARPLLERRLAGVDAVIHNQDNREHDLLDSDDYYQFEGGLAATVTHLKGEGPRIYHNDHSRPERPVVRTLEDEIARVVRARLVNPKWIAGVMRHGYKGAFEIAASLDYLFAFAATTGAVRDHHFDLAYEALLADEQVADFMRDANPDALREAAERLLEAVERGLWRPRSNSAAVRLAYLAKIQETAA
ncbi:cobaltochelatase subunit CobN [Caulobacter endophyticus]|uniref:cobaltochelatase subunit CobN n=1 Tax=Caulobacter endophyticus TaxID=2172652 RepID=UPI00240FFCF0|nr:cobaltochelatase subunit CobN [Caulobacter endophyticus]MDG2527915.1 cobaltochelatase subunit CobN [Caulobacter endophyticus]